jgi:urease accessory protein
MNPIFFKPSTQGKLSLLFLSAVLSSPVLAHHPMGGKTPETLMQGLLSGLAHPVIELDHLLFLICIATATAIARIAPTRAIALLLGYGAAGILGTMLRVSDFAISYSELAVAASLLLVGLWLWMPRLSILVVSGLWMASGVIHGYAYGEAVVGTEATPLLSYLVGLALVQALLMSGAYLTVMHLSTATQKSLRPIALTLSGVASSTALVMLWAAMN